MSCFISSGYTLDCRNASTGGLNAVWILGGSGNQISGWTSNVDEQVVSASGTGVFYKFELTKQGSSLTRIYVWYSKTLLVRITSTLSLKITMVDIGQDLGSTEV